MKGKAWWKPAAILLLLFTVVLSGCSSSSSGNVKVNVGEVTRSVFYAPEYVAHAQGFFEEEGLDVEIQTTAGETRRWRHCLQAPSTLRW